MKIVLCLDDLKVEKEEKKENFDYLKTILGEGIAQIAVLLDKVKNPNRTDYLRRWPKQFSQLLNELKTNELKIIIK